MSAGDPSNRRRVAIVYHYFAHYRTPVARELCAQEAPFPQYTLISDREANLPALNCIDPALASRPVADGGLRWRFIRNRWLTPNILWQPELLKIAVSKEYDTIIFLGNAYFLSTWVAAILSRLRGKRVLMWSHGLRNADTGIKRLFRRTFYSLANDLLLYGHRAKGLLMDWSFDSDRLHVIYNSLDYDAQCAVADRLDASAGAAKRESLFGDSPGPVLIYIGRVTEDKELDLVLDAMALLDEREGLKLHFVVVGDGPSIASLREQAATLGLGGRVALAGPCYEEEEIGAYFRCADLCVVPGPVGLTAIHALTYGTPVLTNDDFDVQKPEVEAIVEGETGGYFKAGDSSDLAAKLRDWVGSGANRDRDEVARRCRQIIDDRYNPHVQARLVNAAVAGEPARAWDRRAAGR